MQLQLLIEIKPYKSIYPIVSVTLNDNPVMLVDGVIDVSDSDIIKIKMQGKGLADTEIDEFNNIISDKAVVLYGIKLAGVEYNLVDIIEYYNSAGLKLPYSNYMHVNGELVVSIDKLLHTLPILPECTMSFDEMLHDIFGKIS